MIPFYSDNPYIRAVSHNQLSITAGESVTLIFIVATDSDGTSWNNEGVTFTFTNRSGVESSVIPDFRDSNPNFPQYYIYTIQSVDLSHAGVYTASAPSMST